MILSAFDEHVCRVGQGPSGPSGTELEDEDEGSHIGSR